MNTPNNDPGGSMKTASTSVPADRGAATSRISPQGESPSRRIRLNGKAAVTTLLLMAGLCARADVANTVPWCDSFESYTNGTWIVGTNGWSGQPATAGVVTNDLSVTNYQARGGTYPVPGPHSNVLALAAQVANTLSSVSGGVVRADFLALPMWLTDAPPAGDVSNQCAICVSTNGLLTIWHHNRTAATNEWCELVGTPPLASNLWHRFTIVYDYSNNMFQVAIDEAAAMTNAAGWTQGGAQAGGSWFYMVQTNGAMSQVAADAASLDDWVAARRSLAWSITPFTESVTNNGTIDAGTPLTVALAADTFAATGGENLVTSGKLAIGGLPSNLVAVARAVTSTQVVVTLTGAAAAHEAANGTNLVLQFADSAFTLGRAWDVTGIATNVALAFSNTPSLSYSTNGFFEAAANDGTLDNGHACLITLTNGVFVGAPGEDFASAGSAKVAITNLPAGLTGQVLYVSATQLSFSLLGAAISNAAADTLGNLTLSFANGAFAVVPASSVFNATTTFSIRFTDPSRLSYTATVFTETETNNGTVGGSATLTLTNKAFNANPGDDLGTNAAQVVSPNLPPGLILHVVCVDASTATLTFGGSATAHALANSLTNLAIVFGNAAFLGGNAAGVAGASVANLRIGFNDPRMLTYSGLTFREIAGGAIDNRTPVTITLAGDTLTGTDGSDFTGNVTVGGAVPPGLSATFTRDSATQLSVRFIGTAVANAAADSVTNLSFTFQDGAFSNGYALFVGNYQQTGIGILFTNDTGFFNVTPYQESFESYPAGTWLAGTNGWSGDSANAGIVTNDAAVASNLLAYTTNLLLRFPIDTTHRQVLYVQDTVKNAIHSETFTNIYVDFMVTPTPVWETPMSDTNQQSAFYVTTNGQLVIWQRTRGGAAEWITLTNAPVISTSRWTRFTIHDDYAHNMFQIQVNQGLPISDPRGWTEGGASPTGSWFYMVQTNGAMTEIEINGAGKGYIDDFTVLATPPATLPLAYPGSVFVFR